MDLDLHDPPPPLARLLEAGAAAGCVNLSELEAVARGLELDDDDLTAVHDAFEARDIEVTDDCGRSDVTPMSYRNGDIAAATTDAMGLFLNEIRRHPLLTPDEEVELASRVEHGDAAAKERMINANLVLVVWVAKRYPQNELALLDLIQEGIFGLIRATEKFDGRRGFRFASYATYWIRQAIQHGIETKARTIRVPTEIARRERTIQRTKQSLAARLGRDPTDREISAEAELSLEQVEAMADLARTVTSLDCPLGDDGGSVLGELLGDDRPGPDEQVEVSLRDSALRRAVRQLPDIERRVVELRYWVDDRDEPVGILETSKRLGITQPQARRIEAQALRRLAGLREIAALRETA